MEIVTKIAPLVLAIIMLGLGLGLSIKDFTRILRVPKDFFVGFFSQLVILPIVALGIIFFIDMVGYVDIKSKVMVIIATLFLSSVVYWWWWSTYKIYQLSKFLSETEHRLYDVTTSLKEIRQSLRDDSIN